jgi:hypothetical protein
MYTLEAIGIFCLLAAIAWSILKASSPLNMATIAAIALFLIVGGFAQPTIAAAANDNALSAEQKVLNETLRTDPAGVQYEGIEYPQAVGTPLSDRQISARIYDNAPDDLKVSVSSGAVRLSGTVRNMDTAQRIVQNVREIPGVHEVSYDLVTAS